MFSKLKSRLQKFLKPFSDPRDRQHQRMRSFLGALLIYFSYGGIIIWGSIRDYLVSYFRQYNKELTLKHVNILLAGMAIPCGIGAIFSMQITNKIGFKLVFKSCALIYAFGVFFSAFCKDFYLFAFFYSFLSGTAAGFSYTPIIYTIWKHFDEIKGEISGYLFGVFGVSSLFFIPFATFLVNPENKKAIFEVEEGKDKLSYFGEDVYRNVPRMLMIMGFIFFVCCFCGSHLLEPCENSPKRIEQRSEEEGIFNEIQKSENRNMDVELNSKEIFSADTLKNNQQGKDDDLLININKRKELRMSKQCPNLKTGLFSQTFIVLFINSILIANFSLFLNINFKTYGLTKIKDDYFITFAAFINGIASTIGRVFWGFLLDKISFKTLYLLIQVNLAFFSMTFPLISYNVSTFFIWIIAIAFCDGGMMCILGPGLIKIYGMEVGSKLYPIKACSFYISLIIVPIIQFFVMDFVSMDNLLHLLAAGNIFAIVTGLFVRENNLWKKE